MRSANLVTSTDGIQLATNYVIATETEIALDSRVWLPGADTGDVNEAQRAVRGDWARALDGGYRWFQTFC
jgi:hypothetical protein